MDNIFGGVIRRLTHRIGWEISSAIENVIWSIGIGCLMLCCFGFIALAVAWQIMFNR
ncbi:MAG TPA: hypothetical protein VI547_06905 [Anaerolineales bacterium]|nr:hypothetical protein [Anaerolineales bacterium]